MLQLLVDGLSLDGVIVVGLPWALWLLLVLVAVAATGGKVLLVSLSPAFTGMVLPVGMAATVPASRPRTLRRAPPVATLSVGAPGQLLGPLLIIIHMADKRAKSGICSSCMPEFCGLL